MLVTPVLVRAWDAGAGSAFVKVVAQVGLGKGIPGPMRRERAGIREMVLLQDWHPDLGRPVKVLKYSWTSRSPTWQKGYGRHVFRIPHRRRTKPSQGTFVPHLESTVDRQLSPQHERDTPTQ